MQIEGLATIIVDDKMLTLGGDGPNGRTVSGSVRDEATGDWFPDREFGYQLVAAIDWLYH